jgi:hypothetical protein
MSKNVPAGFQHSSERAVAVQQRRFPRVNDFHASYRRQPRQRDEDHADRNGWPEAGNVEQGHSVPDTAATRRGCDPQSRATAALRPASGTP